MLISIPPKYSVAEAHDAALAGDGKLRTAFLALEHVGPGQAGSDTRRSQA